MDLGVKRITQRLSRADWDTRVGTTLIYVANFDDDTISVIDGATNTAIATVPVGRAPSNVHVGVNPSTNLV